MRVKFKVAYLSGVALNILTSYCLGFRDSDIIDKGKYVGYDYINDISPITGRFVSDNIEVMKTIGEWAAIKRGNRIILRGKTREEAILRAFCFNSLLGGSSLADIDSELSTFSFEFSDEAFDLIAREYKTV